MNRKAVIFAVCAMTGAMTLGACGNTISEEISKQEKAGTRKEKKPKDSTEQTDSKKDIKINDDIYHYFGMGYDDLVAEFGTCVK